MGYSGSPDAGQIFLKYPALPLQLPEHDLERKGAEQSESEDQHVVDGGRFAARKGHLHGLELKYFGSMGPTPQAAQSVGVFPVQAALVAIGSRATRVSII